MSKAPWVPLYIGDYLADTQLLTCEDHGAYLLLLMACYRAGGKLPDDNSVLSKVVRLGAKKWLKKRPIVEVFFSISSGYWSHNRVTAELDKRQSLSNAGTKAMERRYGKKYPKQVNNHPSNLSPNQTPNPTVTPKVNKIGGQDFPIDFTNPASTKGCWQTGVFNHMKRRMPEAAAQAIYDGYIARIPEAIQAFELAARDLKELKQSGKERAQ